MANLVPCPYCDRQFSKIAAERHIPNCKDARHKAKPPPSKDEILKKQEMRQSQLQYNISSKNKLNTSLFSKRDDRLNFSRPDLNVTPRKEPELDESNVSKTPQRANGWTPKSKSPFKSSFMSQTKKDNSALKDRGKSAAPHLVDQSLRSSNLS